MSLFLQMKEKLPSIYVIKHEVKFIIRLGKMGKEAFRIRWKAVARSLEAKGRMIDCACD